MGKPISIGLSALIACLGCSAAVLAAEEAQPNVITNSIGMKLVLIPAGDFMMGRRESAPSLAVAFKEYGKPPAIVFEDEHPRHRVRITKPFYLGAHEVTVGQLRQFVKATGYKTDAEKGTGFRGFKGAFGWNPGTENFELSAKYSWQNGFKANPFGLCDMHGNVGEWCADWRGREYYAASPAEDPTGPSSGDSRVVRGGDWYTGPAYNRSASRVGMSPGIRGALLGFRVARAL